MCCLLADYEQSVNSSSCSTAWQISQEQAAEGCRETDGVLSWFELFVCILIFLFIVLNFWLMLVHK